MNFRHPGCFAVLAFASALHASAAPPTVGQPAPPLTFTQLYGAPEGTKTDWASLHGKVVVLEFWATWCAPCIAEIPHLNELAHSLADKNVQFISVDDEDPIVIEAFIAKKPMAGWVGLDTSKKVLDDYGVQGRPSTIVIDPRGKIAAVLRPELLEKEQLASLAAGAPTVFPTDPTSALREEAIKQARAAAMSPGSADATKPLFEISISPGDPDKMPSMTTNGASEGASISYDLRNNPLPLLFQFLLGTPPGRIIIHGASHDARYNMRLISPGSDTKPLAPAIELAIAAAAGMKLSHVSTQVDAYVLQATPLASARLTPTASRFESMSFFDPRNGKLKIVKTGLDGLASSLERALGTPVVNEAGISGEFDADFTLPKDHLDAAKAALESNLGLTLVKGRRNIDRIVLDPLPAPSKSAAPDQAAHPDLLSSPAMQTIAVPR